MRLQDVPGAPDRLYESRFVGIRLDLLTEAADVHVKRAVRIERISPDLIEKLFLGNDRIPVRIKA